MGFLAPLSDSHLNSNHYIGSVATKKFRSKSIHILEVSVIPDDPYSSILALFERENEPYSHETGIFYWPETGEDEMLRLFSWGAESFKEAHLLYADLVEELEYEQISICRLVPVRRRKRKGWYWG